MKTFCRLALIPLFFTFARADLYVKNFGYNGDGNPTQSITGFGFAPVVAFVGCDDASETYAKTDAYPGSNSKPLDATAEDANGIVSLNGDGITVGSNLNASAVACKGLALGGTDVDAIEYTGTGAAHSETGFAFGGSTPSLVWILPSSAQARITVVFSSLDAQACLFNTSQCASTVTVQGLEANGFSVDTNVTVNQSGQTYEAFGIVTGAAHFELSSYVGNGADDRNVTTGLTACNGVIVADQTAARQWRANFTNEDLTVPLFGGTFATDIIQGFSGSNFQVGTSTQANASGETYYYFAWEDNAPSGCTPDHLHLASSPYNPLAVQYVDTTWPEFRIEVHDAAHAVCTGETGNVVITKNAGAGTLGGTLTVAAVAGVAPFTTLTHNTAEAMSFDSAYTGITGITGTAVTVNAICSNCVRTGDNCPNSAGALCYAPATGFDARLDMAPADLTPVADMALFGQEDGPCVYLSTEGYVSVDWYDGAINNQAESGGSIASVGARLQIRTTLLFDNGAAGRDYKAYHRTDEVIGGTTDPGWTQDGSTVTQAGTTTINDSKKIWVLGQCPGTAYANFSGTIYQFSLFAGINTSQVAHPDFRDNDQDNGDGTWTDPNGNVWYVDGPALRRLIPVIMHRRRGDD